ncbi:hypothetical protein DFH28DRAFT_971795 [Melampsora americana]|nr:hypothetical protein DFH28DRAFT_971795 [Melampsora americana]
MRGETISSQEYGCLMPDQSRRIITIGAKTIRTDPLKQYPNHSKEDILGGLIYVHDVTDEINRRREAERERERLRQEAIASDDANQSKSTFLSNMSHEIRTPIASVLGIIELLLGTELDSLQRDYAETIKFSADGLLDVVGDILDFSKIECGKLAFDPSPFNLKGFVSELDRIFTHTARSKRSRFQSYLTIDPSIGTNPEIIGDKGRVRQVLSNLVSNSLKFAPAGQITLDLKLEKSPPDRLKLSATIKDDGIGLTPESLRILTSWQPFSQAESSTSRLYGGSGLGLCIVKTLVDAMDGTVSLESEGLGKGCKAKVEMMLQATTNTNDIAAYNVHSPESYTQPNPRIIPESTYRRSSQSTKRRTRSIRMNTPSRLTKSRDQYWILLAEDNPIMAKITIGLLKKIGLSKVDLVENGKEAVERIKNEMKIYDLVILDLIMPVLDGFQATKEIRELESKASNRFSLPIIALSASATRGDRERCTEVQMDDYLTKPIKSDVLEERVLHFLALGEKRRGMNHQTSESSMKNH